MVFDKILFLDIDGVLNCVYPTPSDDHEWVDLDEWRYGLNPQLVARLRFIIANTNCKIVISSSWRHHTNYAPYQPDRNWRDVLAEMLGRTSDELYAGYTPIDFKGGRRGVEINQWLSEHQVNAYCVVDDETIDIVGYVDDRFIVKTDMKVGMTPDDAKKIVSILGTSESTHD